MLHVRPVSVPHAAWQQAARPVPSPLRGSSLLTCPLAVLLSVAGSYRSGPPGLPHISMKVSRSTPYRVPTISAMPSVISTSMLSVISARMCSSPPPRHRRWYTSILLMRAANSSTIRSVMSLSPLSRLHPLHSYRPRTMLLSIIMRERRERAASLRASRSLVLPSAALCSHALTLSAALVLRSGCSKHKRPRLRVAGYEEDSGRRVSRHVQRCSGSPPPPTSLRIGASPLASPAAYPSLAHTSCPAICVLGAAATGPYPSPHPTAPSASCVRVW